MSKKWISAALLPLISLAPLCLRAQMEKIPAEEVGAAEKSLKELVSQPTLSPIVKNHLIRVAGKKASPKQLVNAVRTARQANAADPGRFVWYTVPAMSEVQYLPDAYPVDGQYNAPVRIVMAQDEYEPGSFVIYPFEDLGKVRLSLSEFKTADGKVFPASDLDLKVVKVWYQNGNGWYSYFGDTGLKLLPELLLNDEDLIKVDTENERNYARITEKDGSVHYRWISAPLQIDKRIGHPTYKEFCPFQPMRRNFQDAKTLQPVTLKEGEFKQFFLTAHARKGQAPGLYKGSIRIDGPKGGCGIPVAIRVLPFELPKPCAYSDTNKPFLVSSYSYISFDLIMYENGGDFELAKIQFENTLANQVAHNQDMHMVRGNPMQYDFEFTSDLMRKVGMRKDYIMGGGMFGGGQSKSVRRQHARAQKKYVESLGYKTAILGYGDEPGAGWVVNQRDLFSDYQSAGLLFFIAGGDQVFHAFGYGYDFFNTARRPEDPEATRRWNEVGHAWVAWYAVHHVGTESPSFNRRQNGLAPYLCNYSALCNYAHHYGPYNDRRETYKPMVFAYGCGESVLDTLEWEGFREGLDDIRYATLLKRLAEEANASPSIEIQHTGRAVLQFFAELDPAACDMAEVRMEMIRRILELRTLLKK